MTELEKKVYEAIANGKGLKGAEIAAQIGVEKKTVNSTLASSINLKALVKQDADFRWWLIGKTPKGTSPVHTIPTPDSDIQDLCNYYLNCLMEESRSSVSQFLTSKFDLQYAIIHGLEINPYKDKEAMNLLSRIKTDKNTTAYMGSPVRVYTITSKSGEKYKKIAPVFLFPISDNGGKIEISPIPMINMEVLLGYAGESQEGKIVALTELEKDLGLATQGDEIEMDELILRLASIRKWDYRETINPYELSVAPFSSTTEDGIYNRAIIIESDREPYTQGLESELMTLSKMPVESYKGTALYAWIKREANHVENGKIKPLLEVLPLNTEQAEAVNSALHSDLTIVTGPPGTGKSQVVTDLLINIAWNGKSALFSSKNNKAVDVVDLRVNALCKRPVVLRIGSNQYASRLAEIIEGILFAKPNASYKADAEYYLKQYETKSKEAASITTEKEALITSRNTLDELEQKYCIVREKVGKYINENSIPVKGQITQAAVNYVNAHAYATKENQSFFVRLFWGIVSKKRISAAQEAARKYDNFAFKFGLRTSENAIVQEKDGSLVREAKDFDEALHLGQSYKNALKAFSAKPSLEELDKKLAKHKKEMAEIAGNLWNKWLLSQAVSFSAAEREEMSSFVAAMKIAGDVDLNDFPDLKKKYTKMIKQMTKYLQCWAVTSLSAKGRIPFEAGMFDYVIIDEASQCDIASILPLLYRAKRAVIIGDPMQLSHISTLTKQQDGLLLQKYKVEPNWSYSTYSLYALAQGKVAADQIIQLKDHFRSCSEIIEFSNEYFYDGTLRTATQYAKLKTPAGEKPGIRWIDTIGKTVRPNSGSAYNIEEAKAVVKELDRLISGGYQGTIGVTTPFRRQADEIRSILEKQENHALYDKLCTKHEFLVNTVHTFQGDERDIMIFSPVVSNGAPDSTVGFLENTGNLFNVAITRARAVLVVVGNYQYCAGSRISYLKKFADYYKKLATPTQESYEQPQTSDSRDYPWVANPEQVSDWERLFYTALYDSGIKTIPQYPVDKYKLDFALILRENKKLDIEIDGEMYHRQWNGELCYRDQLRNQRMFELGWDVQRFWVYQIRDDMQNCIKIIKEWMAQE